MASAELEKVFRYLDQHRPKERSLETVRSYLAAMVGMEPPAADIAVEEVVLESPELEQSEELDDTELEVAVGTEA